VGDGELNEGSNWEALLFAAHHKLTNLTVIVDANGFQAMGQTHEIMDMESLSAKLGSFGLTVRNANGHDLENLRCLHKDRTRTAPYAVIASTVKGKGVSFMENNNAYHYTRLTDETYRTAMSELA